MSKVVIVRAKNIFSNGSINTKTLDRMVEKGLLTLTDQTHLKDACPSLLPSSGPVGIKINTLGGKRLSTRPETGFSLARAFAEGPLEEKDIIIWDRSNRELRSAGFRLNRRLSGIRVYGTDTEGVGYSRTLVSHKNVGSLFSVIQQRVRASVSLAILKDHGLAGITAGMKNYFGAIHNPNKYHNDRCDPYVAEVFETDLVRKKHSLTVIDGLIIQYHRGPSYHARWAAREGVLIFSEDPVSADYVGWQLIEKLRAKAGLPSLKQENREPLYLKTAERMGLGTADPGRINILEVEV
ncbi:MAG: DUF362 domain-containing protein [Candidatus Aminicenantales bacterium]